MRLRSIAMCIVCAVGCTLSPEPGTGGGFATSGADDSNTSNDESEADGSSSAAEADSGGGSSDAESSGGTFGPMDGGGSSSSSAEGGSSGGEASTGAPAESGGVAPGGAYAACDTNEDCGMEPPGLACLKADENGAAGFCSPPCGSYGATPPDPNLCPDSPAGATVVCLEGLIRNCALACVEDGDCPEGTACLNANGGNGPYCFGV